MQAADKHKLDEVTTAKISEFASCWWNDGLEMSSLVRSSLWTLNRDLPTPQHQRVSAVQLRSAGAWVA